MDGTLEKRSRPGGWIAMIAGLLLCVGSVGMAFVAWIVLVPWLRGVGPPEFSPHYSHLGLWEESQRPLRFGLWAHDHGSIVADFGGKEWVEGLVASMVSGKGIGCDGGHREAALEGITNLSPPEGSDLGAFWSQWWSETGDLSQAEWIRDGFAKDGIHLSLPPKEEDWPALLQVLGESQEGPVTDSRFDPNSRFLQARRARYNAFRWLRDSGFDPVAYALDSNGTLDSVHRSGLLAYREFEKDFRTAIPGRLDFAPSDDWGKGMPLSLRPKILDPKAQAILAIVLAAVLFAGAVLARWGWTRLTCSTGKAAPSGRGRPR
jgi:hypothetical protein